MFSLEERRNFFSHFLLLLFKYSFLPIISCPSSLYIHIVTRFYIIVYFNYHILLLLSLTLFYLLSSYYFLFLKKYLLCYYSCPSSPPTPLHPAHPLPPTLPPYSSCPWVILISSLASTFPTLFLPSPCLFSTYHLCYLFSVPFPPLSPSHSPIDNPPCGLHLYGSVSVLVVCLVCSCFCFRCGR